MRLCRAAKVIRYRRPGSRLGRPVVGPIFKERANLADHRGWQPQCKKAKRALGGAGSLLNRNASLTGNQSSQLLHRCERIEQRLASPSHRRLIIGRAYPRHALPARAARHFLVLTFVT